jgi:hypothetical protein
MRWRVGCSFGADQVAHPAHLNARDTTLVYVSRAPQVEIQGLKERMGWELIPWYTLTDDFDKDFGVDEWHGHNAFIREGDRIFRTYFVNARGDSHLGTTWSYLDITRSDARRSGRTRPRATRRPRRTSGGTTTTRTARTRDRSHRGSRWKRIHVLEMLVRLPACRRPGRLPGRRCRDAGHDLVDRPTQDVDMVTPDPSEAVTYLDGPLPVTGIHSPVVPFEEVKNLHRRFHRRRSESARPMRGHRSEPPACSRSGGTQLPRVFHLPREPSNSRVTAYGGADSPAP